MLKLRDNLTLATTKLRVRRVRLTITLIVAGILFTVLVAGSFLARGTITSLESFTKEGFLNRFIVMAGAPGNISFIEDKKYVDRTAAIDKDRLDRQMKEAKRLGVEFDPKSAPKAVTEYVDGSVKHQSIDISQPAARQAIAELSNPDEFTDTVKAAAAPYHPTAIYHSYLFGSSFGPTSYELAPIVKNAEVPNNPGGDYTNTISVFQNTFSAMDNNLLNPFLLDGASLTAKPGDPIPILAPIDSVEKLLGLAPLDKNATPTQKISRLTDLRLKAKNFVFEVCYRNKTALDTQAEAKQQANDIAAHKSEADYQMPNVIYGAPTGPCQSTPIAKDTRTADQKTSDQKMTQFKEEFGDPAPITARVSFRIVGIMPQPVSPQNANAIEAIVSSFFTTTLGVGWYASAEAAAQDPILGPLMRDPVSLAAHSGSVYVELSDRATQKRFIDQKGCSFSDTSSCSGPAGAQPKNGKLLLIPYGNPLAALYDLGGGFKTLMRFAIGIIAILSAIVMMGTIGKVIADSRKETSVFRAVGAKRHEIAQVYLLYTAILATLSFLVALIIGLAIALYLDVHYSPGLSAAAVLAFNSHNLHKSFQLIAFQPLDFLMIYGFILLISLVSAGLPLSHNLQRNPVKDMREE